MQEILSFFTIKMQAQKFRMVPGPKIDIFSPLTSTFKKTARLGHECLKNNHAKPAYLNFSESVKTFQQFC